MEMCGTDARLAFDIDIAMRGPMKHVSTTLRRSDIVPAFVQETQLTI